MTRYRKLLIALYAAGLAVLAWLVPVWPATTFSTGGDCAWLTAFTAKGIVVTVYRWQPGDVDRKERQLWAFDGRPWFASARRVKSFMLDPETDATLFWWAAANTPGRRWLLDECVAADDVNGRLRELVPPTFPASTDAPVVLSADTRFTVRPVGGGAFVVYDRVSGRPAWEGPNGSVGAFFGRDEVIYIADRRLDGGTIDLVRRDVASGRELTRYPVPNLEMLNWPAFSVDAGPDGRYALVHDGSGQSLAVDLTTGNSPHTLAGRRPIRWVAPPGCFVAIPPGDTATTPPGVEFLDPTGQKPPIRIKDGGRVFSDAGDAVVPSPDGGVIGLFTWPGVDRYRATWPAWILELYDRTLGRFRDTSLRVNFYATMDGRCLGSIPLVAGNGRGDGAAMAAFSPDGRWVATVTHTGQPGSRASVEVYAWPLRRPWLMIFVWAALPPLGLSAIVSGVRRLRRQRPVTT